MIVDGFIASVAGYRPNTIVHVGAGLAQELGPYESLGPRQVIWLEADADLVKRIRRRIAPSTVTKVLQALTAIGRPKRLRKLRQRAASRRRGISHVCIEALVADEDGREVAFNLSSNNGASSSIYRQTEVFRRTFPGVRETGSTLRLRSSRLQTILRAQSVEPGDVDVLVIDLQGAELLCLKGAGEYLDHVQFLEVEASRQAIYEGGTLFPELDTFVCGRGFARVSEVPWHGDVVYVRRSALGRPGFERLRAFAAMIDAGNQSTIDQLRAGVR